MKRYERDAKDGMVEIAMGLPVKIIKDWEKKNKEEFLSILYPYYKERVLCIFDEVEELEEE